MRFVAIIQARMGSSRLPGKVMKRIAGQTVLSHVIRRVALCSQIDEVVVATTAQSDDRQIVGETEQIGVSCFRGSENDVLRRYYEAAHYHRADVVLRVTADCPLIDPELLSNMALRFKELKKNDVPVDYLSNVIKRTFPRGLDAEFFSIEALTQTDREATQPYQREHVTPYLYHNPQRFALHNYASEQDRSHYRWTLDTEEDFKFVSSVYEALHEKRSGFSTEDVCRLLESKPHLSLLNFHVRQKSIMESQRI